MFKDKSGKTSMTSVLKFMIITVTMLVWTIVCIVTHAIVALPESIVWLNAAALGIGVANKVPDIFTKLTKTEK